MKRKISLDLIFSDIYFWKEICELLIKIEIHINKNKILLDLLFNIYLIYAILITNNYPLK